MLLLIETGWALSLTAAIGTVVIAASRARTELRARRVVAGQARACRPIPRAEHRTPARLP